ncbi:cytochrome P450 [Amylocystis lapponica]|nr:cytochrome P450 [Amylocystis lapponica]
MMGCELLDPAHSFCRKDMSVIRQFINPIIKEALLRKSSSEDQFRPATPSERATLIDKLIDATQDPQILADEVLNILIAGRDTTAATLTFATYFLAMHPMVLSRLRTEILAHVGPTAYPNADNVREMKYLRAVINETLRLFPSVPANVRSPVKSTTLPPLEPGGKPFYIPAGSKYVFQSRVRVFAPHKIPGFRTPCCACRGARMFGALTLKSLIPTASWTSGE